MKSLVRRIGTSAILILIVLMVIASGGVLYAQSGVYEVAIPRGGVDYSGFPSISVNVIVSNETRGRVEGLSDSDFSTFEDGEKMPAALDEVEVGIQVVFVLDASASTRQRGDTGYTRLEEGKQIITTFAENRMAEGLDLVAVLAPESSTTFQKVAPLPDDPSDFTLFKNTVRDGVYLYELPADVVNTPLNDMVSQALTILERDESGYHQAVVVISDGVDEISDREVSDTVNKANQLNIPIHTVIFGPSSNWGGQAESNMKRLSLDSHGLHLQLSSEGGSPDPLDELIAESMTALYDNLTSQRTQYRLSFSSAIFNAGRHEVEVRVGSQSTSTGFSLNLRPPQVSITSPAVGGVITRATDDPNLAARDIEPRTLPVLFDVSWPDGYVRELAAVDLLVDGVAVRDSCIPPCSEVTWNVAELSPGSHSLRIRVRDQQGLQAESDEVPLTIEIITPTPIPPTPTPKPTPMPTPTPALACEEQYTGVNRFLQCYDLLPYISLVVALIALVIVIIVVRRPPRVVSSVVNKVKEMTEPFFLDRGQVRGDRPAKAMLVVLEGDDSHQEPIDIVSENTRLGRDEALAQVVLNDRSVSRLHARITEEEAGRFVLYDEGSTSGSYVNYEPVGIKGQWLQHDDIVNLGRVKLQFKVKARMVHDDTIAMKPVRPSFDDKTMVAGGVPPEPPKPEPKPEPKDEFATQPYVGPDQSAPMPAPEPPLSDDTQPFLYGTAPTPPAPPPSESRDDEGISTEPFVPLDPMDLEG